VTRLFSEKQWSEAGWGGGAGAQSKRLEREYRAAQREAISAQVLFGVSFLTTCGQRLSHLDADSAGAQPRAERTPQARSI
jgi:hypothetical protein